jgi:PAS domain S-box-containing protein
MARLLLENLVLLAAYWGLSHLDWIVFRHLSILPMPFWPAAGLALVAAVKRRWRVAPGIMLGAILANWVSLEAPLAYACCIGTTNTLGPLAAAAVIRAHVAGKPWPEWRGRDYTVVFLASVGLAPLITATGGMGAKWLLGIIPFASVGRDLARWWLGHAIGTLIVAPIVLFFLDRPYPRDESNESRTATYVLRATLLLGAFFWVAASLFDYFYFRGPDESFWSTVLARGHHHVLVGRLFFVSVIAAAGFTLSRLLAQLAAAARRERAAADHLRKSRRFLADLVENSGTLVSVKDREGRYQLVNRLWEEVTGLKRLDVLGKTDAMLFPAADAERFRANDLETLQARQAVEREESLSGKDGTRCFLSIKFPLRDGTGQVNGVCGMSTEITERKRVETEREKLQAQLTHAQKMESVGRLAGGVAHDFNNMLQSIAGNAELALLDLPEDSPARESIVEIRRSAERSVELTRQLLAFARRQTIAPRPLDLNETVASMLKMLQRLMGETIELRWTPATPLWPVRLDPSQVDQILANLCVNARDAIAGTGTVAIATANLALDRDALPGQSDVVPGDYVMLSVSDTGRGMDATTRAHLFEPFFTTKELGKGTGLGLATIFGIVKQNDGYIDVSSEPGSGTRFNLYFPRTSAEPVGEAASASGPPLSGSETVLLVEDETQILDLGRRALAQSGYTVLAASSPREALRLAEQHVGPIHLLITDVVMPDLNGKELHDQLAARHPGMRCLFMSGYTADVIAHHGVLDEGLDFLQKPFSLHLLREKVRELLGRPSPHS